MSDDFFDEFDSEPLDAEFFQQVDTLEQVALSQHPRAAAKPPPSKRQKLDNGQAHGIEGSYGLPEHERPSMVQQRLAAEGDHESADLAAQWERALANLESENARLRQQQASLDELQRRVLAKEGEAATLRRNQSMAEQRNSKALLDEQAKNKQLQDQITAMKQQFVHDLERINTQRAFQKHEQEAAQRRAKLQWQHSKQRSPVKPSTSGRAGGFQSSFVDAQPGPTRHSPRSSPTKGAKGVASPPSSKPQSPLANRAQDAFSELQNEDVTMNVDPVAVPSDSTDQDPVDLSIIRAKIIASLFAHRYTSISDSPATEHEKCSAPTFHLITNYRPSLDPAMDNQIPSFDTSASKLFSILSSTSSDVASEEVLQDFADRLVHSIVSFIQSLAITFASSQDDTVSQSALQPLAAILDWLSISLIRFQPYFARASLRNPALLLSLSQIAAKCASVKPEVSGKKQPTGPGVAFPLALQQRMPKSHFLVDHRVKAHILFPTISVLEGLVWCPEADTFSSLDSAFMDSHLIPDLLDITLPSPILFRSLRWLLLAARHRELYRSLLASPFARNLSDADGQNSNNKIPLIEVLAGYLHYASADASPTMLACIHQTVLLFFLRLYTRNNDAPTLLSSSQALVPKLIFRMAADTGLLYESDGEGFGRLPPRAVIMRLHAATKLLYLLAGTPQQLQRFNLKTQIHQSLAHYNGVLQMFNVSIGRLATADAPRWLDPKDREKLDETAEPAQLLLDLVLSPGEQDDLYALNQGEDPDEAEDATNDHEEQQIAAEHLAELEDEEATLDD